MKFKKIANMNDRANGICSIYDLCSKTVNFRHRSTNNTHKQLYRYQPFPLSLTGHLRVNLRYNFAYYDKDIKCQDFDIEDLQLKHHRRRVNNGKKF